MEILEFNIHYLKVPEAFLLELGIQFRSTIHASIFFGSLYESARRTGKPIHREFRIILIDEDTFQSVINLKFSRTFGAVGMA